MDKVVSWIAKLLPLLPFYPKWVQYFVAVLLASVLVLVFVMLVGAPAALAEQKGAVDDDGLPKLIALAHDKKVQSKYVLESVTMIVSLDPAIRDAHATAKIPTRFVYTLFALEDLGPGDFTEGVHGTGAVARLAGSNEGQGVSQEVENQPAMKSWVVPLVARKGQRVTVTTGVVYIEDTSRFTTPNRRHHQFSLAANQDAFCYPNQEDVIGELRIMVEAPFGLTRPGAEDSGLHTADPLSDSWGMPDSYATDSEGIHRDVLSARWTNVVPGQVAGVRVTWPVPSTPTAMDPR